MYNRFDKGLQPKQSIPEKLLESKKQRTELEEDVHKLQKVRRKVPKRDLYPSLCRLCPLVVELILAEVCLADLLYSLASECPMSIKFQA